MDKYNQIRGPVVSFNIIMGDSRFLRYRKWACTRNVLFLAIREVFKENRVILYNCGQDFGIE